MTKRPDLKISHGMKKDEKKSYADTVKESNDKKKINIVERKNELIQAHSFEIIPS
jgi:hypothetical protein